MVDTWTNCYNLSWKGLLYENKETGESAFVHPAKMSRSLIFRIVEHILAEGWVKPGDTILDPFGGVACGSLPCALSGLQWVGCELEQKFVDLGQQNIALWESKFAQGFPRWKTPALLQGDSRQLSKIIGQATAVISSPPYENLSLSGGGGIANEYRHIYRDGQNYGDSDGQLGAMKPDVVISSPPFAGNSGGRGEASRNGIDAALFDRHSGGMKKGTGESEGNLDHLPMGSGNIQAIISSPPFADSVGSDDPDKRGGLYRDPKRRNDTNLSGTYGETDGQLGAMKDGGITAVTKSPPYEESMYADDRKTRGNLYHGLDVNGNNRGGKFGEVTYGQSPNQLGNESGETFWQAAAAIVSQCAMVLPRGGHCVWVTKRYIKNGRIVDFTAQWIQLCEALGFKLLHHHKALLVKDNGSQSDMFGKDQENRTERKSFFRILHESKQKAAVHWEILGNSDRVTLLALAYAEAFKAYQARLAKNGKAPGITAKRVLGIAQMTGWKRDGKPYYDTSTAIDNEDVLCFVKI